MGQWELDCHSLLSSDPVLFGNVNEDAIETIFNIGYRGAANLVGQPGYPLDNFFRMADLMRVLHSSSFKSPNN